MRIERSLDFMGDPLPQKVFSSVPHCILAALMVPVACTSMGCKKVEPAPEDLDGLFHYFWSNYEDGTDEDLALAVINAHDAIDGDVLEDAFDGSISDIDRDELDLVEMRSGADPSETTGMFLVNLLPCTLEQVEEIVISLDQMKLYDGAYESYSREYTSDLDDYLDRREPFLSWVSDIEAKLLGAQYSESVNGGVRHVASVDEETSPYGPFVVARYWMPQEAEFSKKDFFFTQDYQIEIYYERASGELVHLYGLWRYMGMGTSSTDADSIVRLILNGLKDWDKTTADLCESGDY